MITTSWHINMKGLHGEGSYCRLATGVDGLGLSYAATGAPWTKLLPRDRFFAHLEFNRRAGRPSRGRVPRPQRMGWRVLQRPVLDHERPAGQDNDLADDTQFGPFGL